MQHYGVVIRLRAAHTEKLLQVHARRLSFVFRFHFTILRDRAHRVLRQNRFKRRFLRITALLFQNAALFLALPRDVANDDRRLCNFFKKARERRARKDEHGNEQQHARDDARAKHFRALDEQLADKAADKTGPPCSTPCIYKMPTSLKKTLFLSGKSCQTHAPAVQNSTTITTMSAKRPPRSMVVCSIVLLTAIYPISTASRIAQPPNTPRSTLCTISHTLPPE